MPIAREPLLKPVPIAELRPTQMTVGMREVRAKQKEWRERDPNGGAAFLGKHMVPVVLGPNNRHYVTDHHHLARALHEEGVSSVLVTVISDLSTLDKDAFWFFLDNRALMHPFDAEGKRRDHSDIPKSIESLVDDPYRSLAGELRLIGGYAKDTTPFSEFLWADFLRRRIRSKDIARDFDQVLKQALDLARSKDASYLPGWCGPARVPQAGGH